MKDLDYGKDYQYAHDDEGKVADMDCLPETSATAATTTPPGRPRKTPGAAHGRDSESERREASRIKRGVVKP